MGIHNEAGARINLDFNWGTKTPSKENQAKKNNTTADTFELPKLPLPLKKPMCFKNPFKNPLDNSKIVNTFELPKLAPPLNKSPSGTIIPDKLEFKDPDPNQDHNPLLSVFDTETKQTLLRDLDLLLFTPFITYKM